jgi:hypothetical protein
MAFGRTVVAVVMFGQLIVSQVGSVGFAFAQLAPDRVPITITSNRQNPL